MYGYNFNQQQNLDRINNQIAELEKIKAQMQQPVQTPTNLTQNFQLTPPNRDVIKYASSMEEVQRDSVIGDTPYFAKDMSVVWIKNTKGEVKTYELTEIVPKDDKDIRIEFLEAQIKELKEGMKNNAKSDSTDVDGAIESEKSTSISNGRKSNAKSK